MPARVYHVYIMASASRRLYVGVTGHLARRVNAHLIGELEGFTKKYHMTRLVYAESTSDVIGAIRREKQIKGWVRARKLELIASLNPDWLDLGDSLLGDGEILRCAQDDTRSSRSINSR